MTLEKYLDNELRKDTMDVVILDEQGNWISNTLPGDSYNQCKIISISYEVIAMIKVKQKWS